MQQGNKFRRLALDRRRVRWREGTGVALYRDALADAAARTAAVEPIGDGGDAVARGALRDLPRALRRRVRGSRDGAEWLVPDLYRLAQRHFSLTGSLLEIVLPDPPALVHWSHPLPLRLAGAANLYTVHDLVPIEAPDLTGIARGRHMRLLNRVVAEAAHLVTVSETVRAALCAWPGVDPARVTCCYQSVDPVPPGALPPGLVHGGYFLALGRVESRKNIERLILAHRASGSQLQLVICGPEGHWTSRAEQRRVAALMAGSNLLRLGWQPGATAAALIAGARALLMPSLAEGFGRPVIEAMRMGVPAMASAHGAAAEIAGGAALLVDPLDPEAIAAGIRRLGEDAALRTQLAGSGQSRAREFSIESFARRLADLYDRIP